MNKKIDKPEKEADSLIWKRLNSIRLFTSRWFNLRQDTCHLPNGITIDDYYVLELPDGVAIVATTERGELILVRQYKHGLGQVVLELPAGIVETGEEPAIAIQRELLEETGYKTKEVEYIATINAKPARMSAKTLVFFATNAVLQNQTQLDATESIETIVIPVSTIPELVKSHAISSETSLAALLLVWDRLFSG